ncbi:hypothetical protein GCM10010873_13480 [Cypionkella aquatica]|uniref:Uncharacterized protein n=1 Tax=Cypionkella aquatica TaxID=1756042 RepID=A0AA37X010_9RHOB|nr:hypothetical protein [Cypionkella aquatica]GLS86374.1 hypothetical protein GCM10010873_13480 [Cypionkella aquatica]
MRVLYGVLPIAAALTYGVWQHYAAQVYVGDLPPFDLHFYDYDEALVYVAGLNPDAKAIYLGPLRSADTALMLLLAATLIVPVWRLGWLWCLPALAYATFDFFENGTVAALLTHGIREAGEVDTVTLLTLSKFVTLGIAGVLALWGLWRMRGRNGG